MFEIEGHDLVFGADGTGPGGETYASIIAEFENLSVDREFAETAYTAALGAYDITAACAARHTASGVAGIGTFS